MRILDIIERASSPACTSAPSAGHQLQVLANDTCPLHTEAVLYVSTDVQFFECDEVEARDLAPDLTQVDGDDITRAYRRLDANWLTWLTQRTAQAVTLAQNGSCARQHVLKIKEQLKAVHAWAVSHWGKDVVRAAIYANVPKGYGPPARRLAGDSSHYYYRRDIPRLN